MADFGWTMATAKVDFNRGLFKGVYLDFFMDTWRIKLISNINNDEVGYLLDARDLKPRSFKTTESALSSLNQIGFRIVGLKCAF